jgi:hypothetical protein
MWHQLRICIECPRTVRGASRRAVVAAKNLVAALMVVMIGASTPGVARGAEKEAESAAETPWPRHIATTYEPQLQRPAILPALYATLGAVQAWDVYSTRAALSAGAREANPTAAAFAGSAGALLGLKAATTAGTIVFAERMWKKNRVGAIVMLAAINGATAAVSLRNMRNARLAAARQ